MLVPIIANKTFQALKNQTVYAKWVKKLTKKFKNIRDPHKKAQKVHQLIDEKLEAVLDDPVVKKHVSCKAGCSACCHTQVSAFGDEVVLLADIISKGMPIDWRKLYVQAQTGTSAEKFYKLPYEMRSCVFLGQNGNCRVYANRPSVCRTNYVVSDPSHCSTKNGLENSISLLKTDEADLVVYSAFGQSSDNGTLPSLLWEELHKKKALNMTRTASKVLPLR